MLVVCISFALRIPFEADSCIRVISLLQASQESATDLRLWTSYVQLLALLGSQEEAIKVAEKALSMVQVRELICSPISLSLSRSEQ